MLKCKTTIKKKKEPRHHPQSLWPASFHRPAITATWHLSTLWSLAHPVSHMLASSEGTDTLNESHLSRRVTTGGLGSVLKPIHCHPKGERGANHVTDDRACGISLTPDPETFPLSAPAVANGWPGTSVTTDHWDSFVLVINHIRKGHLGVRSQPGELWLSGVGSRLWYLGSTDNTEVCRQMTDMTYSIGTVCVCLKINHKGRATVTIQCKDTNSAQRQSAPLHPQLSAWTFGSANLWFLTQSWCLTLFIKHWLASVSSWLVIFSCFDLLTCALFILTVITGTRNLKDP